MGRFLLGWRQLRTAPVSSAIAVSVQGFGLACTIVVFALVSGVHLRRPSGVPATGDDLVQLRWARSVLSLELGWFSRPEYEELRQRSTLIEGVAASNGRKPTSVRVHGRVEVVNAASSSSNYLAVLGVRPVQGRGFTADEERPGGDAVCLVNERLARRWGLGESVPGANLTVNGRSVTVVGILPEDFHGTNDTDRADMWLPLGQRDVLFPQGKLPPPDAAHYQLVARLKPTVARQAAETEATTILKQFHETRGGSENWSVVADPLLAYGHFERWQLLPIFAALSLAAALLLSMTVFNAAGLGMAMAMRRQKEVAIRLAIGASPRGILLDRLAEALTVGLLAGGIGIIMANVLLAFLDSALITPRLRQIVEAASLMNWRMPAFVAVAATFSAIASGLLPALTAARTEPLFVLQGGDWTQRPAVAGRMRVLIAQMAVVTLLGFVGVASVRSIAKALAASPGFTARDLAMAHVDPLAVGYDVPRSQALAHGLIERLNAAPEIQGATLSRLGVINPSPVLEPLIVAGPTGNTPVGPVPHDEVAPNYFEVMQIPIVVGESFKNIRWPGSPPVVIINASAARDWPWPESGPIGSLVRVGNAETAYTVIGVAGDVRSHGVLSPATPAVYLPLYHRTQVSVLDHFGFTVYLRPRRDLASADHALRAAVAAIDRDLPLDPPRPVTSAITDALAFEKMLGDLNSLFAGLGLLVGAAGLYATASQFVVERGREFGVRLAVGADAVDVGLLVVRWWLKTVGTGLAIGLGSGALMASALTRTGLAVLTVDGSVVASVSIAVLAVTFLAVCGPAWRVVRLNPAEALRLPEEAR